MMSSPLNMQWLVVVGLTPKLTEDDITAYFQAAVECGTGLVRKLIYLGRYKAKAMIGMEGLDSKATERLTKQDQNILGIKLRVSIGQEPSESQLQQAITFPSTNSSALQVMQPPVYNALPQQFIESEKPVPRPRTKKPTSSLVTEDDDICALSVAQCTPLKDSWTISDADQVKVLSLTSNCSVMQAIAERYTPDNTIVIEGIDEGVSVGSLQCLIKKGTELEEDAFTLERKDTKALMVLLGKAAGNLNVTLTRIESHLKLLKDCRMEASRLTPVQSVLVRNMSNEACRSDKLKLYFKNRKKSGGGKLLDVKVTSKGQAIITFQKPEGVEGVLARNHADQLGEEVELQAYHPILTSWSGDVPQPKWVKSKQKVAICHKLSNAQYEHIRKCNLLQGVDDRLADMKLSAQAKLDSAETVVCIEPTVGSEYDEDWSSLCNDVLQEVLGTISEVSVNIPEDVAAKVFSVILDNMTHPNVTITLSKKQDHVLITGSQQDADCLREAVERIIRNNHDTIQEVQLPVKVLVYADQCIRQMLERDNPHVFFKVSLPNGKMHISGKAAGCEKFLAEIEKLQPVKVVPMLPLEAVQLLSMPNGKQLLQGKLLHIGAVSYYFMAEDGTIPSDDVTPVHTLHIVGSTVLKVQGAVDALQNCIAVLDIPVPKEFENTHNRRTLSNIKQAIEKKFNSLILTSVENQKLRLVCETISAETVKQETESFIGREFFALDFISVEQCQWGHTFSHPFKVESPTDTAVSMEQALQPSYATVCNGGIEFDKNIEIMNGNLMKWSVAFIVNAVKTDSDRVTTWFGEIAVHCRTIDSKQESTEYLRYVPLDIGEAFPLKALGNLHCDSGPTGKKGSQKEVPYLVGVVEGRISESQKDMPISFPAFKYRKGCVAKWSQAMFIKIRMVIVMNPEHNINRIACLFQDSHALDMALDWFLPIVSRPQKIACPPLLEEQPVTSKPFPPKALKQLILPYMRPLNISDISVFQKKPITDKQEIVCATKSSLDLRNDALANSLQMVSGIRFQECTQYTQPSGNAILCQIETTGGRMKDKQLQVILLVGTRQGCHAVMDEMNVDKVSRQWMQPFLRYVSVEENCAFVELDRMVRLETTTMPAHRSNNVSFDIEHICIPADDCEGFLSNASVVSMLCDFAFIVRQPIQDEGKEFESFSHSNAVNTSPHCAERLESGQILQRSFPYIPGPIQKVGAALQIANEEGLRLAALLAIDTGQHDFFVQVMKKIFESICSCNKSKHTFLSVFSEISKHLEDNRTVRVVMEGNWSVVTLTITGNVSFGREQNSRISNEHTITVPWYRSEPVAPTYVHFQPQWTVNGLFTDQAFQMDNAVKDVDNQNMTVSEVIQQPPVARTEAKMADLDKEAQDYEWEGKEEKQYDEEIIRETLRQFKGVKRLPMLTLPSGLLRKGIISDDEYSLITGSASGSRMQQIWVLMDIMLTKDGSAILRLFEVLQEEHGYEQLVTNFFAEMDAVQKENSTKPAERSYDEEIVQESFREFEPILQKRLPISTFPCNLMVNRILSSEEYHIITAVANRMEQRTLLVDILLTKDAHSLLRVLAALQNHECGYGQLVKNIYAHMDETVKAREAAIPQSKVAKGNWPPINENVKEPLVVREPDPLEELLQTYSPASTVVLHGIPTKTSRQALLTHIAASTHLEIRKDFQLEERNGIALVRLESHCNQETFMKQMNMPKHHLNDSTAQPLQAIHLHPLDSILLTRSRPPYQGNAFSKRKLQLYFSNRGRSGGIDAKDVVIRGKNQAVISFKNTKDLMAVLDQSHSALGPDVSVCLYHPILSEWTAPSMGAGSALLPVQHQPFNYPISDTLYKHLSKYDIISTINAQMCDDCCADVTLTIMPPAIAVRPILGSEWMPDWQQRCEQVLSNYMGMFTEVVIDVPPDVAQEVEKTLMFSIQNTEVTVNQIEDRNHQILVGKKEEAHAFKSKVDKIVHEHHHRVEEVNLPLAHLVYIDVCLRWTLSSLHPSVTFSVNMQKGTLQVRGTAPNVKEFLCSAQKVECVSKEVRLPFPALNLLASYDGREFLQKHILDYDSGYFFVSEDDSIVESDLVPVVAFHLVAENNRKLFNAHDCISTAIAVDSIDTIEEFKTVVRLQAWDDMRQNLQQKFLVHIHPDASQGKLYLASLAEHMEKIKADLLQFLIGHCHTVETIPVHKGQAEYLQKYCKEWVDLQQVMHFQNVQCYVQPKRQNMEILLRGETSHVKLVAAKVRKCIHTIDFHYVQVNTARAVKIFQSAFGEFWLSELAKRTQTSIQVVAMPLHTSDKTNAGKLSSPFSSLEAPLHQEICVGTVPEAGMTVSIKHGDITKYHVDVIVNTANENLNHVGGLGRDLVSKGGDEIQLASTGHVRRLGKIKRGTAVLMKTVGKLPCRAIVHMVVGPWCNGGIDNEQQWIKKAVYTSLQEARDYATVAFPALGTGAFRVAADVSAQGMLDGIMAFAKENPRSTIEKVTIMLFQEEHIDPFMARAVTDLCGVNIKDQMIAYTTRKESEARLERDVPKPSKNTAELLRNSAILKSVQVKNENLTEQKADVYINFVKSAPNFTICGQYFDGQQLRIRYGCKEHIRQHGVIPSWGIATTASGNLHLTIHAVIGDYRQFTEDFKQELADMLVRVLQECNRLKAKAVAIPALGAFDCGFPSEVVAKIIIQAVVIYLRDNPATSVKEVKLVSCHDEVHAAYQAVHNQMQQEDIGLQNGESPINRLHSHVLNDVMVEFLSGDIEQIVCDGRVIVSTPEDVERDMKSLLQTVLNILHRAENEKLESVTFPASMLKFAGNSLDQSEIVCAIYGTITSFIRDMEQHTLKYISVVIPEGKNTTKQKSASAAYKRITADILNIGVFSSRKDDTDLVIGEVIKHIHEIFSVTEVWEHDVQSSSEGDIPLTWDPMLKDENCRAVVLTPDSHEYKEVADFFSRTMQPGVNVPGMTVPYRNIVRIRRVQNRAHHLRYTGRKQEMQCQNPPDHLNEWKLWHDCKKTVVKEIHHGGFNRSFRTARGNNAYGHGIYFAKDASYAAHDRYSPRDETRSKHVYLARVLVGEYTVGNRGLIVPPPKDPNNPAVLYDSVVDNKEDPQVFCIFQDFQAYPDYHIEFC